MKLIVRISAALLLLAFIACQPATKKEAMNKNTTPVVQTRNPYYSRTDTTHLDVPDSIWRGILPDSVYRVGRNKATERAFTGKYYKFNSLGTYYCAVCGNRLFRSDAKFASECGWPSFYEPSRKNSVIYQTDTSHGLNRTEVLCGRCGSHLGHVFDDGPPPTGKRYCMNSIILDFVPELTGAR